jgi:hypothetical protein
MANSLIKGLAITLGGGLALGVGFKLGQGNAPVLDQPEPPNLDPILDRLEKVETTVASVEQVLNSPSPMVYTPAVELEDQVRSQGTELAALRAQILQIDRGHATQMDELSQTVSGLEHRIPELIDESIRPRFEALHERVQREMQETASQTLELFADRIQSRVVEKISAIENDLGRQSQAINALRDSSLKTDESMQKLLAGVESLADKISSKFEPPAEAARQTPSPRLAEPPMQQPPRRAGAIVAGPELYPELKPATATAMKEPAVGEVSPVPVSSAPKPIAVASPIPPQATPVQLLQRDYPAQIQLGEAEDVRPFREPFKPAAPGATETSDELADRSRGNRYRMAAMAGGGLALTAMVVGGIEFSGVLKKPHEAHAASTTAKVEAPAVAGASSGEALDAGKMAAENDRLAQAQAFFDNKEYGKAEGIYRSILKDDPTNKEVKRRLASTLFRQDKIDETAKILNSIGEEKGPE